MAPIVRPHLGVHLTLTAASQKKKKRAHARTHTQARPSSTLSRICPLFALTQFAIAPQEGAKAASERQR